jgi:hypothetical protein
MIRRRDRRRAWDWWQVSGWQSLSRRHGLLWLAFRRVGPARSPSPRQTKSASQDSLKKVEHGKDSTDPELSTFTNSPPTSSLPYLSPLRAAFLDSKDASPLATADLFSTSSAPSTASGQRQAQSRGRVSATARSRPREQEVRFFRSRHRRIRLVRN